MAVYTSIVGAYDDPPIRPARSSQDVDHVLFSDSSAPVDGWIVRSSCALFVDPVRNSRTPKLLAHQYLASYDYSLWIDGSVQLLASPRDLIETYLARADMALFKHPTRDCLYDEAFVCRNLGLDDPTVIMDQALKYAHARYPSHDGLTENSVILRRHTSKVEELNNAWWSEYCSHTRRDQLSFNYVCRALEFTYALFPGTISDNPGIVTRKKHLKDSGAG